MEAMEVSEQELSDEGRFIQSPLILLAGDDAQTTHTLRDALRAQGFDVQLAPGYAEIEALWLRQRNSEAPVVVLLEVSCQQSVETAVDTALLIKQLNPHQFVGYLADPMLRTGLAGDAIFPRGSEQLAEKLRSYFLNEL